MQNVLKRKLRSGMVLFMVAMVIVAGYMVTTGPMAAPAEASLGAPASPISLALTPPVCTTTGTTRTYNLYARVGNITLPASSGGTTTVPIWGYSDTANGTVTSPGPTLVACENDTLQVNLYNTLNKATSLSFPALPSRPDLNGAPAGSVATPKSYTFSNLKAGSSLYEAGLTKTGNGKLQVTMGMFGAVVIYPTTPNHAYVANTTNTLLDSAYNDESVLIFSEIDPALNKAINPVTFDLPATFDLHSYAPKYWLINGKAYPDTGSITSAAGNKVLLRYLNAGQENHSIGTAGLHSWVFGVDGKPLAHPYQVGAETIAAGQSYDMITTIPATAPVNTKFTVYSAANHLDNTGNRTNNLVGNSQIKFGGMLTYITVGANTGPVVSNLTLNPTSTDGTTPVAVSATVLNGTTAEYFIDTTNTGGTGTPMTVSGTAATATIPATTLSALSLGNHTVNVHANNGTTWSGFVSSTLTIAKAPTVSAVALNPASTDGTVQVDLSATVAWPTGTTFDKAEYYIGSTSGTATSMTLTGTTLKATIPASSLPATSGSYIVYVRAAGMVGTTSTWGSFASTTLTIVKAPTVSAVTLNPASTDGTVPVALSATVALNGTTFDKAEYYIGSISGTGTPMTLTGTTLNATIPAGSLPGANGSYTVYVRAAGLRGTTSTWSGFASTTLTIGLAVDNVPPTVSAVTALPSPNNGTIMFDANTPFKITASITDATSNIVAAEAYIDTTTPGVLTSIPMFASGTSFGTAKTQSAYVTIALNDIKQLGQGTHTVNVRGQDAAGNWSSFASQTFVVDLTAPVISNAKATPAQLNNTATSIALSATATDSLTNVTAAEYFVGATDPGVGKGTALTISGTTNATLSATISVPGTFPKNYGISVRAKDAAGNWSTATKVTIIFADGFESNNLSRWSSNTNTNNSRLAVNAAAKMTGNYGLRVTTNGTNTSYVTDITPTAETAYNARFYFNPNTLVTGAVVDIFQMLNSNSNTNNTTVGVVQVQRTATSVQIRYGVRVSATLVNYTSWSNISTAAHSIEVSWTAGASTSATLYVDGGVQGTLTAQNTSGYTIESVRLGIVATSSSLGNNNFLYFDAFASTKGAYIGQ